VFSDLLLKWSKRTDFEENHAANPPIGLSHIWQQFGAKIKKKNN